jgi:hypothetical protein
MTLLNLEDASVCRGGLLEGVLESLTRLVDVGEILAWSRSRPRPGDKAELSLVEIPLLKLKFRPQARLDDDGKPITRLYSLDFAGCYLAEADLSTDARAHVPDVRNFVWLTDNQDNHSLLMPNAPPQSCSATHSLAFQTETWLEYRNTEWLKYFKLPYFLYPLHPSRSYLNCESVASALHLALLRARASRFSTIAPLLPLCFKDTPFDKPEKFILDQLVEACAVVHPDAIAIRLLLWYVWIVVQSLIESPWKAYGLSLAAG